MYLKFGHTGTLDPNATGVLPLLIGKGTLLSKYLINHDKIYEATLKLGIRTDTSDVEGNIIEKKDVDEKNITKENIENVLKSFIGESEQIPPIYSSIKVNGKKLYEYARKGESVKVPSRKITIYDIKLLDISKEEIKFIVSCSKGTYIRTLCEDIAIKLDTVGYMKDLNRIQVGDFNIKDSITIEELERIKTNNKILLEKIITIEDVFKNNQSIKLDEEKLRLFLNGGRIKVGKKDDIYKIFCKSQFIGIGIANNGLLKRDIII